MSEGSWVTTITATYMAGVGVYENSESLADLREFIDKLAARTRSITSVEWDGLTVTIVDHYGTHSKYDAVRPAISALREIFDPIADDEFYRPWPIELTTRTVWTNRKGTPSS